MPSALQLVATLLAGATLVACTPRMQANNVVPTASNQEGVVVTPQNQTFTVSRGQTITVGLPDSGGAGGYTWHLDQGFDTRVVQMTSNHPATLPQGAPLGKFADTIFEFQAQSAGTTTLSFSLYRDWEGPTRAADTRRFPVTVH